MVEYNEMLSNTLKALSDTTRRSLLTVLCQQGPTRVTDLAKHFDMSLNGVSKHIKVLEGAGLVKRSSIGRVHLIEARTEDLSKVTDWIDQLQSIWSLRLRALEQLLTPNNEEHKNE